MKPCVIVHGGAGNTLEIFVERYKSGTKAAAKAGFDAIKKVPQIDYFLFFLLLHLVLLNITRCLFEDIFN